MRTKGLKLSSLLGTGTRRKLWDLRDGLMDVERRKYGTAS